MQMSDGRGVQKDLLQQNRRFWYLSCLLMAYARVPKPLRSLSDRAGAGKSRLDARQAHRDDTRVP